MLGGLHFQMTLLKCIGDLLNGSGWTSAISQSNIATPGKAESFLKASHIKKTARAHQMTACVLYKLRQDAYTEDDTEIAWENWSKERSLSSVQFKFWELIYKNELTIFTWDRATHEGNFTLYVEALSAVEWLFHALDHYNYTDTMPLLDRHPVIYAEYCKCNFTVETSNQPFPDMSLGESHEQNNACVKMEDRASIYWCIFFSFKVSNPPSCNISILWQDPCHI